MDQNSLPPIQTTARDDAVLKALVGFVGAEALRPGERLPTERILAERLKVSRNTVREALTRWEGLGLVERRQGSGTFLKAAVSPDMLHLPLTLAGGNDFTSLMQTLEIRRALEAEAAALCAERASPADIAEIEGKLDIMEQAFRTLDGMSSEEDWEFHQAIYRVSGNPLFEQIIAAMHELFHRFWEHPLGVRDFGHASFPYHRTIYERIAARDPQGARDEALKLIATVEDDLKRGAAKLKLSDLK
ncbi:MULTISPECIES: FadR/GntR family transcriptional regulator [unclassified Mesorhizobium]|uniref:FadR/GntR family transcriptional regulator n=1 Tax=unclassified Mesorhizobium TaxID=325217 RepID=UPI001CCEF881|nr:MULTISPECIES: FadR/GntR family transcriptional regulator [unclassified Mesorhizobium]MBZ9681315.1 FadR family transcriptional regulator [Mesorhizobium sp. CO1-1-2]MBZ9927839.1 FadR family transcriptional regulator [Mesorhizobium sp. BR1-1-4]